MGNMADKFCNIQYSKDNNVKLCNEDIKIMNSVETLDRYNTNVKSHTGTILGESTPVPKSCVIHNRTGSTPARVNYIMFNNTSSTSRPCDTVDNYCNISQEISKSELVSTWLGSASTGDINTERQGKDVVKLDVNLNTGRQECSSLYMWLAGESDQEYSINTNVYMNNSSTLQSIVRRV